MTHRVYLQKGDPFSQRVELAIIHAGIDIEINWCNENSNEDVVPLLETNEETLTHSVEIMDWVVDKAEHSAWLDWDLDQMEDSVALIELADGPFWGYLQQAIETKNHEESLEYLTMASGFLFQLETLLLDSQYLLANKPLITDFALIPFVHYFSIMAENEWNCAELPNLKTWHGKLLQADEFKEVFSCR